MSIHAMATGATVAGAACGAIEALWRQGPVLYAMLMYGTAAALGATGAGLVGAPWWRRLKAMPFTVGFTCVAALAAGVLARFALWRDVFLEAPTMQARATVGGGAAALTVGALAFLSSRLLEQLSWPWLRWARSLPWVVAALFFAYGGYAPLLAAAPSAGGAGQTPHGKPHRGVVLLVIDALRADAPGSIHRGAPTTPHLDALTQQSVAFTHASAQASWTKPAMASILTSQHVHTHRTMSKNAVLPPDSTTVASVLREHRIPSLAVVTNYNLAAMFGFATGFDTFNYLPADRYLHAPVEAARLSAYNAYRLVRERLHRRQHEARFFYQPATAVNAQAMAWLDKQPDGPFFMWLHYMEAHDPYVADDGTSFARVSEPHPQASDAPAMQAAYLDSVRRADAALGALVAELQTRGIFDDTLLIVTADHGEEFGEHGGFYHGTSLYEALLHVPLVMHVPKAAPRKLDTLARQVDIAPTVMGFLNVQSPLTFEGHDLLSEETPPRNQTALAEQDHQGHVLRAMRWRDGAGTTQKLIVANPGNPRRLPSEEWFDLTHDPDEQHALTVDHTLAQQGHQHLQQAMGGGSGGTGVSRPADALRQLDAADEATLRSLGYVQ